MLPEKYTVKNFILGSALKVSYRKVKSDATNVCCNWANGIFAGARQSGYWSLNQIGLILTSTSSTCQGNWKMLMICIKNNDTSLESTDNKQWIYEIFFMPYTVGTVECGDREIFCQCKIAHYYSCNKITTTQIQISRQNWNGFFSNVSRQMMI